MATITYYYNAGSDAGSNWGNKSNLIDSDANTYGYCRIPASSTSSVYSFTGHTGSSIPNWQITKVEVGIKRDNNEGGLYDTDIYYNYGAGYTRLSHVSGATLTWYNITSYHTPWTYTDVRNLDILMRASNANAYTYKDIFVYIVYLRVTYTAMFYRKDGATSQINVYKDNAGMTHYIAVRANGETLYVPCGTVGDAKQTPIRVQIGGTTYSVLSQR